MPSKKSSNEEIIKDFLVRLIQNLDKGKSFPVTFNKEKGRVSKSDLAMLNQELKDKGHTGGFLPFLSMVPTLLGNIVKSFSGQGININEKEGGFLPAIGALLPLALKALPLLLGGIGAASSIAHTANQNKYNNEMARIARGKGFYLNPAQGRGIRDFLKNAIDKTEDIEEDVKSHWKTLIKPFKKGINVKAKDGKFTFSIKE